MDLRYTADEQRFRGDLRAWLADVLPGLGPEPHREDWEARRAWDTGWQRTLHDAGYAGINWPKEFGGRGATPTEHLIFIEETERARAPYVGMNFVGLLHAGPTLIAEASDEQKAFHLPGILKGEHVWCQGFSEPNAGSDLASLRCRAVRDGDDYVINGQKIWTSEGHLADWMILLARTDQEAPKHRGISYLLVDIKKTPGIQMLPLVNLMDTHAFNQVYFDSVRVPKENLVGEENKGWYVATTTLDFERSGINRVIWALRQYHELVDFVRERAAAGAAWATNPAIRHRLADLRIAFEIGRLLCYRVAWQQNAGQIPNYESSMAKTYGSELNRRFGTEALGILGLAGQIEPGSRWAPLQGRIERTFLAGYSYTIAGGTSEIQRNIIAQRGLGLPR